MLQWMLKRGDNMDNTDDGDTTQIDQPDTPAPVFAARAFKRAVFGSPVQQTKPRGPAKSADESSAQPEQSITNADTPSKPPGILLTPGTATARRKKVSFGRDVPSKRNSNETALRTKTAAGMPHTRLNNAIEIATKGKENRVNRQTVNTDASDSEWEEDDGDGDGGNNCNHDMTLDLNDPHSQSGRYWKQEFQKYHADAKTEMEKLLQYKQLAKSYAQQKDAEAIQLAEMLKAEQQKVIKMEKRIAENAFQLVAQQQKSSEEAPAETITKLTKQTALAVQYRQRVQELEDQLEDFLRDKDGETGSMPRKRRQTASPRTQTTLVETRRELRRARAQVKEVGDLREEVRLLKSQVRAAERKAKASAGDGMGDSGRVKKLRDQLESVTQDSRRKDEDLIKLREKFELFRVEALAHDNDSKAVLERAHAKIADLKKEIKVLKTPGQGSARPNSWHPETDGAEKLPGPKERHNLVLDPATTSERSRRRLREPDGIEDGPLSRRNSRSPVKRSADVECLRDRYKEHNIAQGVETVLSERPELGKPKWQPFIPRSPRNRTYLGERLEHKIENGGITPVAFKSKDRLSPQKKSLSRKQEPDLTADLELDVLRDGFKRHVSGQSALRLGASKSSIPPERRAAALARIEKKMAERKGSRSVLQNGNDKENVRP